MNGRGLRGLQGHRGAGKRLTQPLRDESRPHPVKKAPRKPGQCRHPRSDACQYQRQDRLNKQTAYVDYSERLECHETTTPNNQTFEAKIEAAPKARLETGLTSDNSSNGSATGDSNLPRNTGRGGSGNAGKMMGRLGHLDKTFPRCCKAIETMGASLRTKPFRRHSTLSQHGLKTGNRYDHQSLFGI